MLTTISLIQFACVLVAPYLLLLWKGATSNAGKWSKLAYLGCDTMRIVEDYSLVVWAAKKYSIYDTWLITE